MDYSLGGLKESDMNERLNSFTLFLSGSDRNTKEM